MILPDGFVIHPEPPEAAPSSGEASIFPLAAPKNMPHKFGDALFVAQDPSRDAHPQTERICALCGVVKVTVHGPGGVAWREWRQHYAGAQYKIDGTPACVAPLAAVP